jgi:hypothetical protein
MTHGLFIVVTQPQAVHWVRSGHILRNKYVKQLPKHAKHRRPGPRQHLLNDVRSCNLYLISLSHIKMRSVMLHVVTLEKRVSIFLLA